MQDTQIPSKGRQASDRTVKLTGDFSQTSADHYAHSLVLSAAHHCANTNSVMGGDLLTKLV